MSLSLLSETIHPNQRQSKKFNNKKMKTLNLLTVFTMLLMSPLAMAQTNGPALTIKGTIEIKYNTRQLPVPTKGVKDVYRLNINMFNSIIFAGQITDLPQIIEGMFSKSVTQPRVITYDIGCDVINQKNPAQVKNVGRMFGMVPIMSDGSYQYDKGNLEISVLPISNAGGFTSKFGGVAYGKPLNRPANWLDTFKKEAVNITRLVNGKPTTVIIKKYDKMEYKQHNIAAGPAAIYQSLTINGEMLYDYEKYAWFFNNVTVQYADNGVVKIDRLSGTIRWVESPQRKTNGEGEYQFDVRVNEPPPSIGAAFAPPSDESAFFEVDTTTPALTGTMKYKDILSGETTVASTVTVDLTGQSLNKQQMMFLGKLIIFSAVVPMNSD